MSGYQNQYRNFLGFAFVVGPLLWLVGSLFMPLGNLGVGGMIAPFGVALLIPAFMELSRWIGKREPRFGFICTVLALMTTAGVTAMMFAWAVTESLTNDLALTSDEVWIYSSNDPYIFAFSLMGVLFPIMIILVAVGLWRNRLVARRTPALFITGAVSFLVFVVGGFMEEILFPVPVIILLVALAPLGWRVLSGDVGDVVGETSVA